ncbi:MAG: hypothetical protein QMD85_04730, partial [Candidatus Aenigmarchaeota archaeon]|nr:hypothetical protein [Candidatus Aenigmarchaeota archaeon]MDI6722868.1 hypothetical protein [Candidatus Aenigmarchaeota archaeon]
MKIHSHICPCGGYHAPWRCPKISLPVMEIKESFFGPSTGTFVGRIGYPNVFVGPLGATGDASVVDSPNKWFGMKYADIIQLRFSLIRSKQANNVYSRSRLVEDVQELALAKKPADIEMLFKKRPSYKMTFSMINQPMGPSAELQKLTISENPKINVSVEKIARDEIKASEAVSMIYREGADVYNISNILSTGILGLKKNQKLVPTRWSITSIDDILCKDMLCEIRDFPSVNEYLVFSSFFLHNKFDIL